MKSSNALRIARGPQRKLLFFGVVCFFFLLFFLTCFEQQSTLVLEQKTQDQSGGGAPQLNLPGSLVPIEKATIFVSVAAYRDRECVTTLESLFAYASNLNRVFVGISEEREEDDVSCIDAPQLFRWHGLTRRRNLRWSDVVPSAFKESYGIGLESMPLPTVRTPLLHQGRGDEAITCVLAKDAPDAAGGSPLDGCQVTTRVGLPADARGPTYARYLSSLLYNNQDYYMVVDSHSRFIPHWDFEAIVKAREMPTPGVMSHYPNGYQQDRPDAEMFKKETMHMCTGVLLDNNMPKLGARWMPDQPKPVLQGFVAAGFIFGDAQFVKDVPFDPYLPYMFDGEEILYTVRLWTSGWDAYSPGKALLYHNYGRKNVPRYFGNIRGKAVVMRRLAEKRALYIMERENLHTSDRTVSEEEADTHPEIGHDKVRFGLGKERPVSDYWRFVQLSNEFVVKKDNENRWMGGEGLCKAVQKA